MENQETPGNDVSKKKRAKIFRLQVPLTDDEKALLLSDLQKEVGSTTRKELILDALSDLNETAHQIKEGNIPGFKKPDGTFLPHRPRHIALLIKKHEEKNKR